MTGSILAVLLALCQASTAPDAEVDVRPRHHDTVTVTAEKRETMESEVPASITVLPASYLEANRVSGIEELTESTPNLHYAEYADGQYRLAYRGIGAGGFSGNPTWNVALDGVIVPYHRAFRLLDLERVEIVRGPQGTLHGRNTTSGVINVIPKAPSQQPSASVMLAYGSGNHREITAAAGGTAGRPDLFFRVAGRMAARDGFIRNVVLQRDDSHEESNHTLRGMLAWDIGQKWTMLASITRDSYDNNADNLTPDSAPRESNLPFFGVSSGHLTMPVLTLHRPFGSFELTSTTSWADSLREVTFWLPVPGLRNGVQDDRSRSLSEEIRLTSSTAADQRLDWMLGLYVLSERREFTATAVAASGVPLRVAPSITDVDELAAFAQGGFLLSPRLRITGGLRMSSERQSVEWKTNSLVPAAALHEKRELDVLLPRLALIAEIDPRQRIYASVTTGYRAGGFDITSSGKKNFDPEHTRQYEIGYKAVMPHGLRFEVTPFYIDWTDLQIVRQIAVGVVQTDNASKARSYGAEMEVRLDRDRGPDFRLFGGYTNARFADYRPAPNLDYSGRRVIHTPLYEAGASASFNAVRGVAGDLEIVRTGPIALDEANTIEQTAYTLVNARVGMTRGPWSVSLVGSNLTGEDYMTRGFRFGPGILGYFADPRRIIVQARWAR